MAALPKEKAGSKMSKNNTKIAISGYYGFNNCGDEAVLLAIVHSIRELIPNARIVVFSNDPSTTRAAYGVGAVYRWNPFGMAFCLLTCTLLISGGGSLVQDVTSSRSARYYLAIIRMALLFKKKVMIYSQGIGPLNNEKNRNKARNTLNRCHCITVRDNLSADFLAEIGLDRIVQVVSDPVMAFSREDIKVDEIDGLLRDAGVPDRADTAQKPLLLVSVRLWKDNSHLASVAELLDTQVKKGWDVLLVPAHFPSDRDANDKLIGMMRSPSYSVEACLTATQFLALIARADKVFSMRLHGLICAMAMGVPMLALSYDPKVDGFMKQAGLERYCQSFDNLDAQAADALLAELDSMQPEFTAEQNEHRLAMRESALDPARKAAALLNPRDQD